MKTILLTAVAAIALATPAIAQDTLTSTSGSAADANANSASGAQSNNQNANTQGQGQSQSANNAGIGNSRSNSDSNAISDSASNSASASFGNRSEQGQGQTQGQNANNSQGQGQTSSTSTNQSQGQSTSQGNQQGTVVQNTFNSQDRKTKEIRTNNAVPLAASSSFSSDYCGGTASGGASASPIGISIGGAAPVFDEVCRGLRRAERFGMIAANYNNLGQPEMALRAMSMMVWETCTANGAANRSKRETSRPSKSTVDACAAMGLLGDGSAMQPIPASVPTCASAETSATCGTPKVTAKQEEKRRQDQQASTTADAVRVASATVAH